MIQKGSKLWKRYSALVVTTGFFLGAWGPSLGAWETKDLVGVWKGTISMVGQSEGGNLETVLDFWPNDKDPNVLDVYSIIFSTVNLIGVAKVENDMVLVDSFADDKPKGGKGKKVGWLRWGLLDKDKNLKFNAELAPGDDPKKVPQYEGTLKQESQGTSAEPGAAAAVSGEYVGKLTTRDAVKLPSQPDDHAKNEKVVKDIIFRFESLQAKDLKGSLWVGAKDYKLTAARVRPNDNRIYCEWQLGAKSENTDEKARFLGWVSKGKIEGYFTKMPLDVGVITLTNGS